MAGEEVRLRGEGGAIATFSLPLSEAYATQVARGTLVPDDDESAALLEALTPAPQDDAPAEPAAAAEPADGEPPRGGRGSGRAEWAAYAASVGVDVSEEMDRDEIIAAVDGATED